MNGPNRPPEWPNDPDQPEEGEAPINRDRPPAQPNTPAARRKGLGISPILLALGGMIVLLLLLWLFTGDRDPDQDKLIGNEAVTNAAAADPEKLCASKTTYDLIKRELFRRAAQVRGSDQAAFDRLSAYAVLRMENPVLESEDEDRHAANCSGNLSLDLPPGVAVVGGRRTLTSDVDYSVQPAADGSGSVVLLRNADPIITPLATLARVNQPAPQPVQGEDMNEAAPVEPSPDPLAPVPPQQPVAPEPSRPASARPSFDCNDARTRGEIAVCSSAGLAALDRQMAQQFGRAIALASPEQRRQLQQSRDRFLGYRDRCPNNACIGDAYTGRMREIRDIMEGRWEPPR